MTDVKRIYFGTKTRANLSPEEKARIKDYKERFSKWQTKQIDLLTFCINLMFTISIAVSGFIISNQDKNLFKDKLIWGNCSLTKTSLCLLILSATLGILAVISRLNDFRLTKNTIKARRRIYELGNDIKYEATKQSDVKTENLNIDSAIRWSSFFGCATWTLFYLQVGLLILTVWTIVLSV